MENNEAYEICVATSTTKVKVTTGSKLVGLIRCTEHCNQSENN